MCGKSTLLQRIQAVNSSAILLRGPLQGMERKICALWRLYQILDSFLKSLQDKIFKTAPKLEMGAVLCSQTRHPAARC